METPTLNTAKFICNSWFMFNGVRICAMKNGTHPSCIAASNPDYVCGMNIETVATPNSGCPYRIQNTCHFKGSCNNFSCNIRAKHLSGSVESLQSSPQEKEYPEVFCIWLAWDSICDFAIHQDENGSVYWTKGAFSNGTEPHLSIADLKAYWQENINQK